LKGTAKSVEVWQNEVLVGGLYGIAIGNCFFGESMFSHVSNASKAGFITFVNHFEQLGLEMVDCQIHTAHLESLGAQMLDRNTFLHKVQINNEIPSIFDTLSGSVLKYTN
jgi:leucyl/phenylalanyl-tRNA--protein transferase